MQHCIDLEGFVASAFSSSGGVFLMFEVMGSRGVERGRLVASLRRFSSPPPPPAGGPAGSPTLEKLEKGFSPLGFQRFQSTLSPPTGSQAEVQR